MKPSRTEPTIDEIRRVALDLFSHRGFHGTSVRDIADQVGIRGSSMYNHFASKEAILWDLTQTAFAQLWQSWDEESAQLPQWATGEERVRAFVRSGVRYHATHPRAASIINAQLASLTPEHYASALKMRDEYQALLASMVSDYREAQSLANPEARVRIIVFAILQMNSGVATWFRPDGALTVDEVCDTYADLAMTMVCVSP